MKPACDYLFVYGTLRPAAGHPLRHRLLRHADWIGAARCRGRLYDLGRYPGLVLGAGAAEVRGDLLRIREPRLLLPLLDRYEGCAPRMPGPREFARAQTQILYADRPLKCWIYVYTGPTRGRALIRSGDYLDRN